MKPIIIEKDIPNNDIFIVSKNACKKSGNIELIKSKSKNFSNFTQNLFSRIYLLKYYIIKPSIHSNIFYKADSIFINS